MNDKKNTEKLNIIEILLSSISIALIFDTVINFFTFKIPLIDDFLSNHNYLYILLYIITFIFLYYKKYAKNNFFSLMEYFGGCFAVIFFIYFFVYSNG